MMSCELDYLRETRDREAQESNLMIQTLEAERDEACQEAIALGRKVQELVRCSNTQQSSQTPMLTLG